MATSRRVSVCWLLLGLPLVFAAHASAIFGLYAWGVSEGTLFLFLPSLLAFLGYRLVLVRSGVAFLNQPWVGAAISLVATGLSCCAGMSFAFNTFGK